MNRIPTIRELMDELSSTAWEIGEPGERHSGLTATHREWGLTAVWHFRTRTNVRPAPRIMIYRTLPVGGSAREYLEGDAAPVADIDARQDRKNRARFGKQGLKQEFARWMKEQTKENMR